MYDARWTFGDLRSFLSHQDPDDIRANAEALLSLSLALGRNAFAYAAPILAQHPLTEPLADLYQWLGQTDPLNDCLSFLEDSLPDLQMAEADLREVLIQFLVPLLLSPLLPNIKRKILVCSLPFCGITMSYPILVYWPHLHSGYVLRPLVNPHPSAPLVLSLRTVV